MVNIKTLSLGAYQTNCYVIWGENAESCVVIDPGYEPERVLEEVQKQGKTVEAVLLTHGHFDHVGAVRELAAETGCRVYLHGADLAMPPQLTAGPLYYTDLYAEGDVLNLAGLTLWVLHTPGHTPGSVCLLTEDSLFAGDTLFQGSCGRTDLPGGSWTEIRQSLKKLAALEKNYRIYSGHGPSSALEDEKHWNPYMRG